MPRTLRGLLLLNALKEQIFNCKRCKTLGDNGYLVLYGISANINISILRIYKIKCTMATKTTHLKADIIHVIIFARKREKGSEN